MQGFGNFFGIIMMLLQSIFGAFLSPFNGGSFGGGHHNDDFDDFDHHHD